MLKAHSHSLTLFLVEVLSELPFSVSYSKNALTIKRNSD
jgi:hypothetical protein